jgi:hypothetical protein
MQPAQQPKAQANSNIEVKVVSSSGIQKQQQQ